MFNLFASVALAAQSVPGPPPVMVVPVPPVVVAPPVIRPYAPPAPPMPPATLSVRAKPVGPRQAWIGTDDYPQAALDAGDQGYVIASLTVSPEGRVERCTITRSSGHAVLDSTSCTLLQRRARYTPARNNVGQAVRDTVQQPVVWQLAEARPLVGREEVALVEIRDGAVTDCRDRGAATLCDDPDIDVSRWVRENFPDANGTFRLRFRTAPGANGPSGQVPLYQGMATLTIRPDGRIASCTEATRAGRPASLCKLVAPAVFAISREPGDRRLDWQADVTAVAETTP